VKLTQLLLDELEAEAARSKRALEQVPAGKYEWKPHDRSMQFGYLVDMIANIPMWVAMIVDQDELDVNPPGGSQMQRARLETSDACVAALDKSMAAARAALGKRDDAYLQTSWRLLSGGKTVMEMSRHLMIRDTLNHWVHHRGQMTVYLRLMGATVPALYGPSADDTSFA
jgi:uncharacterized damage-inducible protein DinB